MPLADTKKVQTMVNIGGQQINIIRDALDTIKTMRAAFTTASPDVTGTPLEGNVAALNMSINNLDTEINTTSGSTWDILVNNIVPSHRGEAL